MCVCISDAFCVHTFSAGNDGDDLILCVLRFYPYGFLELVNADSESQTAEDALPSLNDILAASFAHVSLYLRQEEHT